MEQHLILVAEIMIDRRFGDAEPRSDVVERRRVKTALVEEVNSCSNHGFLFGIACLVALRLAGEWRLKIGHSLSLYDILESLQLTHEYIISHKIRCLHVRSSLRLIGHILKFFMYIART